MANAAKSAKARKNAGRGKDTGNIVVDLGEEIDRKLRSVVGQVAMSGARGAEKSGSERTEMGRPGDGNYKPGMFGGYKPGGYRPGMFGGYRPWYADKSSMEGSRMALLTDPVKPVSMLGGLALGVVGNRALIRVTPDIVKTDMEVVHTGIAFIVGLIPALVKPNSITLGVAIPGAIYFAGSLVDMGLNAVGVKKPALRGGEGAPQVQRPNIDQAIAAREKLVNMQQNIQRPAAGQYPAGGQRVTARAV